MARGRPDLEEADSLVTGSASEAHEVRDGFLGRFGGHFWVGGGFRAKERIKEQTSQRARRVEEDATESNDIGASPPHDAKHHTRFAEHLHHSHFIEKRPREYSLRQC